MFVVKALDLNPEVGTRLGIPFRGAKKLKQDLRVDMLFEFNYYLEDIKYINMSGVYSDAQRVHHGALRLREYLPERLAIFFCLSKPEFIVV